MNEDVQKFIISCVEIGKDLLDKKDLSENEEKFIKNLDIIADKYFS